MESSSTITEIDPVTRKARVSIPLEYLSKELQQAIAKHSRNARVKGFRPGKAPVQMVEKMYGDSLRWDVISKAINSSLTEAVKKNELQIVGSPKIDILCSDPDKDLEFEAAFSIYPTPTVTQYKGIKVAVEKQEVTDKEVEETITSIRRNKADIQPAKERNIVQADDVLDVSVRFKAKDGTFSPPEQASLGLGDGRLPKEFDEQVIGMKIGETKEVTIPGSADGEEMVYEVTLQGISERVLAELTDDFVANLGGEMKTVEELRKDIRSRLEQQAQDKAESQAEDKILDTLVEQNDFMVPQPLVDDEIRNILIRLGAVDTRKTKFDEIPVEPFRGSFESIATKHVKVAIALDQVASAEKINPDENDLKNAFQEIAQDMKCSEAEARKMYSGQALISLAVQINRRKTKQYLRAQSEVAYTPASAAV